MKRTLWAAVAPCISSLVVLCTYYCILALSTIFGIAASTVLLLSSCWIKVGLGTCSCDGLILLIVGVTVVENVFGIFVCPPIPVVIVVIGIVSFTITSIFSLFYLHLFISSRHFIRWLKFFRCGLFRYLCSTYNGFICFALFIMSSSCRSY